MRPNPTVLKLSANIRRARAEADSHPFNPAVVARFVSQLTTTSTPDDEAVSYLRGHLLPDTFRIAFEQSRNILLSLDRETAPIPWEMFLIDVNAENSAPSARLSMVRQLEEAKASSLPDVTAQHRALVVGPPDLSEDPSFPLLPRAEAEAQHVKELLRANGYDVRPEAVNGLAGDAIRRAHAGSGYSIVHLCGHGQVDEADPSRTGLVLANGDTFSALDLRTWPAIPALVFFNCCHLARMQPRLAHDHPGRLAASLARACIQSGVRVVVAAGWAVNDAAAEAFARTFYERMLNGEMFGAAVANARMAAWRAAPRTLTWAAYQCYGDPHFVLPRIPTDGGVVTRRDGETLSSRRELEDFIREMTLRAYRHGRDHRGNAAAREELTQVAERVVRGVPDGLWNGRLLHKMALLWQQLGKDELAMPAFSLAATYRDAPIALARERELVTRSRNRTQSSSATTVPSEVGVAQQAVDTSQLLAPADLVDQVVIACGRGEHQLASELFAKLDAALLARPLGGIEAMALPERALLLAMWPTLRAQGLQSPPVTSLEDVAAQYATMLESATQTTRLAADRRLADMSSWVGDEKKSMIDELRERLAGIGDQDDPNKGLFGGESTRDGLTMKVAFPPNQKDQGWVRFTLSVEAVSANRPLQGDVVFFLHPSFNEPKVVIPAANNRAEYTDLAWGAFTAGAEVGTTRLELDLAEAPDAPSPFKDR
jgi:hypothetical protein